MFSQNPRQDHLQCLKWPQSRVSSPAGGESPDLSVFRCPDTRAGSSSGQRGILFYITRRGLQTDVIYTSDTQIFSFWVDGAGETTKRLRQWDPNSILVHARHKHTFEQNTSCVHTYIHTNAEHTTISEKKKKSNRQMRSTWAQSTKWMIMMSRALDDRWYNPLTLDSFLALFPWFSALSSGFFSK